MALSINQQLFTKEIYPKIKYDKTLGKYRIDVSDYILLKLTKRQLRILENICIKNNIYLEKIPEPISLKETNQLFLQLVSLRKKLSNISRDSNTFKTCQEEYYQIRNKIFEANQYVIYRIIATNIPNYEELEDKEDLIQLGYEFLLKAIDRYDPLRCENFRWYLQSFVSKRILRYLANQNQGGYYNNELNKLITIRNKLTRENQCQPTILELAQATNLDSMRVKNLLVLEQILNAESLDELEEQEEITDTGLIDDGLEELIYTNQFREYLIRIINTLPVDSQREILLDYYGLDGRNPLSEPQIAKLLGITRQVINYYHQNAINGLKHPTRLKYLQELAKEHTQITFSDSSLNSSEPISQTDPTDSVYEKVEAQLVKYLPQEELYTAIMQIEPKYREVLLYHFDFKGIPFARYSDKIKASGLAQTTYTARKQIGLKKLRIILTKQYLSNNQNEDIHNLLDYLMYNYLNTSKLNIKKRSRF